MRDQYPSFHVPAYSSRPTSPLYYPQPPYNFTNVQQVPQYPPPQHAWNPYQLPQQQLPPTEPISRNSFHHHKGYEYTQEIVYPNSEPFRSDLDKKLTLIEYQKFNDSNEFSRVQAKSKEFPSIQLPKIEDPDESTTCFSLCCILLLLIGACGIGLTIYLLQTNNPQQYHSYLSHSSLQQSLQHATSIDNHFGGSNHLMHFRKSMQ